jgi:hypothetical protein
MNPEIYNDELFYTIIDLVKTYNPLHILEIGSGEGKGSTAAFIKGSQGISPAPNIYCIEARKERCEKLKEIKNIYPPIFIYNVASVPVSMYLTDSEIETFYNSHSQFNLRGFPLSQVIGWGKEEINYIITNDIEQDGIKAIKKEHNIGCFDMVLIDGSPFTAKTELDNVLGAKVIILDDTADIKNHDNHCNLSQNSDYRLICENQSLRNGYSIFTKGVI